MRRRGTRLAVKGQLTVIALTIMAVVFLILAAVSQTILVTAQQNARIARAGSGENLAQSAAAWLTNHLNSDPSYIASGSGPFLIDGSYAPPAGASSVTHGFTSQWFSFGGSGHYQSCASNLVQPCVRFDPATARFSTAYNPASSAMATSLKEENVVATIEVQQDCRGAASECKDSFYSTTIARRGYYNYLAFTNYATLDPAQYSPLGLVNPGSVCQTNNTASGCVPVSYQSNGTPSTNGIFGGGSQTAPVFSGGGVGALSAWNNWNGAMTFGTGNGQFQIYHNELSYRGTGSASPEYIYYSTPIAVTPGVTYDFSTNMVASNVPAGSSIMAAVWNNASIGTTSTILYQQGGQNGIVSGQFTPASGVTQVAIAYQINGPTIPAGATVTWSQAEVIPASVGPNSLYQASASANQNMVPDSSLAFAGSPINPTWQVWGTTYGTGPGQVSVTNPGSNSATFRFYSVGGGQQIGAEFSQPVPVIPGATYTLSAPIDATYATYGQIEAVITAGPASQQPGVELLQAIQTNGSIGLVSGQWTAPAGTTQVWIVANISNNGGAEITAGQSVSIGPIQLTQTGSVQPYAPGPLYTSSSNVTIQGWADVPNTGDQGFVVFSGNTMTGFGIGIGPAFMNTPSSPDMQVTVLFQMVRWIPTGFDVTAGWHQFSLVLNATGQPSVYVDGKLVYSDTGSPPNAPAGPVKIGTDGNYGRYYSGAIADVSVYNTALTASQILDQYNAGSSSSYDAVVALDNPVAFWEMSDTPGSSTAPDTSMNNNTGAYLGKVAVVQPGPFSGSGQVVTSASTSTPGDSLYGALRTNSPTIFVCDGNTSAFDVPLVQATSAQVMTATQPGCGLPSSATTQREQVSPMAMPTNVSSLDQAAFPYIFPDGTSFDFTPNGADISFTGSSSYMTNNWPALDSALTAANTVVLVSGASVNIQNMAIPGNGVLYVNGSVSNVVGVVNGQVTIAAEGNIDVNAQPDPTVGDNLYYYCNGQGAINPEVITSGCSDLLGLDAQGSVAIGPQSYQQTGWARYGTGSAAGWYSVLSPSISVTAGTTYNLTGTLDSTAVSITNAAPYNGEQMIQVVTNTGSYYMQTFQTPGTNGVVTSSWTVPSGVSSVQILLDTDNITVPAGEAVTWSNVTFTQSGSTTNLAAPMANWPANGNPIGNGNGDWNLVPSELAPMVVDAAMTALGNSPGVADSNGSIYGAQWQTPNPNAQNPACLINAPTLTINGAMISEYQGTFGQYLGLYPATNPCLLSGYHKHFFWDSRLAYEQPPFALSSGSGNFVEMGFAEVSRP